MTKLTDQECKKLIFRVAIQCGVSPNLITTKLLSDDDKQDMRNGELSEIAPLCHVTTFREAEFPSRKTGDM